MLPTENFINPCFVIRTFRQYVILLFLKLEVGKVIIFALKKGSSAGEVNEEEGVEGEDCHCRRWIFHFKNCNCDLF